VDTEKELRDIKKVSIPVDRLHYQYIHNVTPTELWNNDMSILNSPHVEMLKTIIKYGFDWKVLFETRYTKERILRREKGMKQWTDEHIKKHITWRFEVLKSLKKHGYKKKKHQYPVRVLKIPFWTSRFSFNRDWLVGPEIWDGGGRCAAACVLGWKEIPCVLCEDLRPGSMDKGEFDDKLKKIEGAWNEVIPTISA